MDAWYRLVTPRKEVREGRSFNPDEFAIHLEQVVSGKAPEDYRDPAQFFSRTCFTKALKEHAGMVLNRLAGKTANTAPVLTLVTQFGGGKTHTLTALYHLASNGSNALSYPGVVALSKAIGLDTIPKAKVAVFVGNAWDPREGRETPWIDIAYQLAGDAGVKELGSEAKRIAPGTETLGRIFEAANGPVLILFDEVLNFINRHRDLADNFYAFIQNLTVATTGATNCATVISLPRSQVEMTESDYEWQTKISKVVRRVAKDLIVNEESEISEVIRRRLFEDLGSERVRKNVAKEYAKWCFERRNQLPSEWTSVDSAKTSTLAEEYLRGRFEACYPFHPAVLSVFQRKWQTLTQYQQTRGTLAMLAQWISRASKNQFRDARNEALLTLGSAPLEVPEFRSIVLGQLGESRLGAAIETDISGNMSHSRVLDGDTKGQLRDIHRRVATAIFFESCGGQTEKLAHLPELRFALCEPGIDTTTIDNAATAIEDKSYYFRKEGADGYKIKFSPTLKKVVHDRRASIDEETEINPTMRKLVRDEFSKGSVVPMIFFPADDTSVQDSTKLILVVMDPLHDWDGVQGIQNLIADWTRLRGKSPRLYPGSLVWCTKKQGLGLREKVVDWLAWRRVNEEHASGSLGSDIAESDVRLIRTNVKTTEDSAKEEVWNSYRFIALFDNQDLTGLKVIDLGLGHSSSNESLSSRVISALKAQSLLNETVGMSYIERNWPPAFKDSGAWPLASLRGSFLNGSLTRLLDPDVVLKGKIPDFVNRGEFGYAVNLQPDGTYGRLWYKEILPIDEIEFSSHAFLVRKDTAERLIKKPEPIAPSDALDPSTGRTAEPLIPTSQGQQVEVDSTSVPETGGETTTVPDVAPAPAAKRTLKISGTIPSEAWNRFGTKLIPKLKSGKNLSLHVNIVVEAEGIQADSMFTDLEQALDDLGLSTDFIME